MANIDFYILFTNIKVFDYLLDRSLNQQMI